MRKKLYGYNSTDIAGIADNIRDERIQPLNGLRNPDENYSGWFLWRGEFEEVKDFFKPNHISHVEDMIPHEILSLGPGYRFLIDTVTGYKDIWYDKALLEVD